MATNTSHLGLVKPAYTDAADVAVINNNMDTIDTAISHILPVITGSTNNSGYTIATGHYFEANGSVYKATASIGTGSSWSGNASAVSGTALNAAFDSLSSKITTTTARTTVESGWSVASSQNIIYKSGDVALLLLWVTGGTITQNAWNQIATIPSGYIPSVNIDFVGINNGNDKAVHCQLTSDGRLLVYGSADAGTIMRFSVTYFCR